MKRIFNILNKVYNNVGFQECNTNKKYKPFLYCITQKIDTGILIYNNFTCELLFMDFEEYNRIYINYENNDFSEERKYLIKHWFLIPNDYNDASIIYLFKQTLRKNKYQKINNISSYTILPTTNCNARCFYCYEKDYSKKNMTKETALDVVEYIKNTSNANEKIFIRWFGGEPLFNGEIINLICKSLNERAISFVSTMTSNGYLFDKFNINDIKNIWKLQQVQITLDGLENTYNNTKKYIYKDTKSPFYKVMDNIHLLLINNIQVIVRLNISSDNVDEIYELINYLIIEFKKYNNFSVYCSLLFEYLDNDKLLYSKYVDLQNYLKNNDLRWSYNLQRINNYHCMADDRKSVVITPEGNLTVCEHHIDDEIIGNIYDSELNQDILNNWSEQYYIDECNTCKLYPKCTLLKKCISMKCTEEYRNYTKEELKKTMIISYQNYLKNKNNQN